MGNHASSVSSAAGDATDKEWDRIQTLSKDARDVKYACSGTASICSHSKESPDCGGAPCPNHHCDCNKNKAYANTLKPGSSVPFKRERKEDGNKINVYGLVQCSAGVSNFWSIMQASIYEGTNLSSLRDHEPDMACTDLVVPQKFRIPERAPISRLQLFQNETLGIHHEWVR